MSASAAQVITPRFHRIEGDLENPFNEVQIRCMEQDLKAAMAELGPNAADMDTIAASIHVVSIWTARAARLYASNSVLRLRGDIGESLEQVCERMLKLERDYRYWVARCEVLEMQLAAVQMGQSNAKN